MEDNEYKTALRLALQALNRRFLSEKELRDKLAQKEVKETEVEAVVAYLKKLRYLDDQRLAGQVAAYYAKSKRYGEQYVRQKLRLRGLPPETGAADPEAEADNAVYLLKKKYGKSYDPKDRQKMYRYLQYRGFAPDAIYTAMGKVCDELTES